MAAKKSATLEFTRKFLQKKPEASFAEIRDEAAKHDLKIYPIVYGRAKALEGLVKVAPYGSKKKEREAAQRAKMAKTETAEAAADVGGGSSTSLESIDRVIAGMRENHEDRQRYREALIKISQILDEIL